jgi:hypothetical protein
LPVLDDVGAAAREVRTLAHVFVRARVSIAALPLAGTLERLCALTPTRPSSSQTTVSAPVAARVSSCSCPRRTATRQ